MSVHMRAEKIRINPHRRNADRRDREFCLFGTILTLCINKVMSLPGQILTVEVGNCLSGCILAVEVRILTGQMLIVMIRNCLCRAQHCQFNK